MNVIKLLLTLLLFIAGASNKIYAQGLPEKTTWEGKLTGIRLILKLSKDSVSGKTIAAYDSPDQGAFGLKVSELKINQDSLSAYSATIKGGFTGVFNTEKTELSGKWRQGGGELPLLLKRVSDREEFIRPQTPKSPASYVEEKVIYYNKDKSIKYGATLTYPKSGKKYTTVILISGSGQQDRDETLFGHKPFWVIADHLSQNGIAVLRVDDRGVGETTGNVKDATSLDFAHDALVGIDYLKKHHAVDPRKIGLVGHSEGGVIAPLAAVRSTDVSFIVSLAGVGIKGADLMRSQMTSVLHKTKTALNSDEVERVDVFNKGMIALMEQYSEKEKLKEVFKSFMQDWLEKQPEAFLIKIGFAGSEADRNIDAMAGRFFSPWMRYFLRYDPATTLGKLKIPVLALNGGKDVQVNAEENLAGFNKWLTAAGNKNFKTVLLPELNHLFQHAFTGEVSEYASIQETIAPEVLSMISQWIKER